LCSGADATRGLRSQNHPVAHPSHGLVKP
jgi:hypothetical protein